jgi:hypothetical protein
LTASATLSFGAASGTKLRIVPGESFSLPDIGWSCTYSKVKSQISLSCTPGQAGGASQGDPIAVLTRASAAIVGSSRPALESLQTPKCCLRFWTFPVSSGAQAAASQNSDLNLVAGNSLTVSSLDLLCRTLASDPDHHDSGPVFFCFRTSTSGSKMVSAAMEASRFHMRVADAGAKLWAYTVTRSP